MVTTMIPTNERGPMKHIKDFINRMIFEQKDIITMVRSEPKVKKLSTEIQMSVNDHFVNYRTSALRYDLLVQHVKTKKKFLIEIDQTSGHYDFSDIINHRADVIKTYLCSLNGITLLRFREFDDLEDIRKSIDEAGYKTIVQSTLDRAVKNDTAKQLYHDETLRKYLHRKHDVDYFKDILKINNEIKKHGHSAMTRCLQSQIEEESISNRKLNEIDYGTNLEVFL